MQPSSEEGNPAVISLVWMEAVEDTTNFGTIYTPHWVTEIKTGDNFFYFNEFTNENTDGIAIEFSFKRVFSIHLMHTFFPSIMIALSSVLSVFVPSDLVPGRMGLCITAFLSMISLFNGAR